jgi:CHAT domain-containing protein
VGGESEIAALRVFADILSADHGDFWLRDALPELRRGTAPAWNRLADSVAANNAGKASSALAAAVEAQKLFEKAGAAAGAIRAQVEEVYALHRRNDFSQCISEARRLAPLLAARTYTWAEAHLLVEEAICENSLHDVPAALAALHRASSAAARSRYPVIGLRALGIEANLDTTEGNAARAWQLDDAGLTSYFRGIYPAARAFQFYSDLSKAAEAFGYSETALAFQRETVAFVVRTGNAAVEAMAWFRLGALLSERGRGEEAARAYESASIRFQQIADQPEMEIYRIDSEIDLATLDGRAGRFARAHDRLERLRAGADRLDSKIVQLRFHQALADVARREGSWNEAAGALEWTVKTGYRAAHSLGPGAERDGWITSTSAAAASWAGLEFQRTGNAAEAVRVFRWQYELQLRPSRAGPLEEYRLPSVPPGTVELGWLPLDESILAWVRDASGEIRFQLIESEAALRRDASEFRRLCADPKSEAIALRRFGTALYAALIPAGAIPAGAAVVLVPHGFLFDLPFAALVAPDGRYLSEWYVLWMAAGGAPAGPIPRSADAVSVGVPAVGRGWSEYLPPIPNALGEARQVAAMFARGRLLADRNARTDTVEAALREAEVFHFAGHSYSTASGEGLLLVPGASETAAHSAGTLAADRIGRLDLSRCRLAVLSSCETAGPAVSPHRSNLARRFLQAGTEWVVGTGWNADSAVSERFMNTFYVALLDTGSVPAALRTAAAAIRQSASNSHPYYWAVFRAYGPN